MANIQSYLEQIEGARYGKDVRSSIVNAIDAVNKESEESVEKVSSISTIASNTLLKADAATVNANNAATQANEAANNANEAAQAIFDEKYILTATTEMVKSGTASPTAKGNALMENLIADSYQKQLSGKNKLNNTLSSQTVNGLSITLNNDKSNKLSGAMSTGGMIWFTRDLTLSVGTYYASCNYSGSKISNVWLNVERESDGKSYAVLPFYNGTEISFTLTEETTIRVGLWIDAGISLNTTIYPMISVEGGDYEPYCGGTPSPNPEYLQTIHSVGDMGWFDGEWLQGCWLGSDGTFYATNNYVCSKNSIPCTEGDLICITESNAMATGVGVVFYGENGFINSIDYVDGGVTPLSGATHFKFNLRNESGITPSTVGHVCVTINGKYALIVDEAGKNRLENTRSSLTSNGGTFAINTDKSITVNGTFTASTVAAVVNEKFNLDVGDYILGSSTSNVKILIDRMLSNGSLDKEWIAPFNDSVGFSVTEDDISNGKYFRVRLYVTSGATVTNEVVYPMISKEGGKYQPYTHNRTYIPLDEPLRGIGDVKDEIVVQDGKYKVCRRTNKAIYDSANFAKAEHTYSNVVYYALPKPIDSIFYNNYNLKTVLSDKFRTASISAFDTAQNIGCITTCAMTTNMWFGFALDTTLEEAQAIGDISVVYQLKEPYYEELDQTPFYNLQSFDEVTNVSIVGLHENVEPTLAMRFPRHEDGALVTTAYCNGKKNEIRMDELTAAMLALSQE